MYYSSVFFINIWIYPEGKQQWILQIDFTCHISHDALAAELEKDHTSVTGSQHLGFTQRMPAKLRKAFIFLWEKSNEFPPPPSRG